MKINKYIKVFLVKKTIVALVLVFLAFSTKFSMGQCTGTSTGGCGITSEYVNDFVITDISSNTTLASHTGSNCSANGYGDYTNLTEAKLKQNKMYKWEAVFGTSGMYLAIWIDFDDNGSYASTELIYNAQSSFGSSGQDILLFHKELNL